MFGRNIIFYSQNKELAPSVSFVGTASISSGATNYTFANVNLGGPGLCVIGIHAESGAAGRAINSVTVGGLSASVATQVTTAINSTSTVSGLYYIRQGTSSGNIVINFNNSVSRCIISVYRILDNKSDIPNQIRTTSATSGTGLSVTFNNLLEEGVGVVAYTAGSDGITSVNWNNVNLRYNFSLGSGTSRVTGGDFVTLTAGDRTISVSHTNSVQTIGLAGAVWI